MTPDPLNGDDFRWPRWRPLDDGSERPSLISRPLDWHAIHAARVAGRKVVYLDHNIWIDLRDVKSEDARACLDLSHRLVNADRAIFPVSHAAASELLQMPMSEDRHRQARMMDGLSHGVTFRASELIYAAEAASAYQQVMHGRAQSLLRNAFFSYVPDYLGYGCFEFPPGSPAEKVDHFMKGINAGSDMRWLTWYAQNLDLNKLNETHATSGATYVERMSRQVAESSTRYRRGANLDRDRMLVLERVALFRQHVQPVFSRMCWNEYGPDGIAALRQLGEGGPERLALAFAVMPSLDLCAHMMTDLSMNPSRRTRKQDFWDFEHAGVAPIYADAFVTADFWLRERLATINSLGRRCAQVLASTRDLLM